MVVAFLNNAASLGVRQNGSIVVFRNTCPSGEMKPQASISSRLTHLSRFIARYFDRQCSFLKRSYARARINSGHMPPEDLAQVLLIWSTSLLLENFAQTTRPINYRDETAMAASESLERESRKDQTGLDAQHRIRSQTGCESHEKQSTNGGGGIWSTWRRRSLRG